MTLSCCFDAGIQLKHDTVKIQVTGFKKEVTGLACLDNKIFAVHDRSTTIYAISCEDPFHRMQDDDIQLTELLESATSQHNEFCGTRVLDITGCATSRSLYFCQTNQGTRSVWRIKFPDKSIFKVFEAEGKSRYPEKIIHNSSEKIFGLPWIRDENEIMRISTNLLGELLVLVRERGRWYVHIYSSIDDSKHKFVIKDLDIEPRHVVESPRKTIIISFLVTKHRAMFVGEMSMTGEILEKYDFHSMDSFQTRFLLTDCYLAIDGNNEIFVADFSNNRIFLLNSQLADGQMILPITTPDDPDERNRLDSPSRLYLFKNRFLIVGQYKIIFPSDVAFHLHASTYISIFDLRHQAGDLQSNNEVKD